jgi:hypothetical protein
VLSFNWVPRHEGVLGKWRYSSTHSLTSALYRGKWSASRLNRFTPRERAPGTHWIGGWVGSRAVVDAVVKRKIPIPRRESIPRTPIAHAVAQRYTDWAIMAHCKDLLLFKVLVFYVVMPCIVVVGYQRFKGPCCLHLQGEVEVETAWTYEKLVSYNNITWRHNPADFEMRLVHKSFRPVSFLRHYTRLQVWFASFVEIHHEDGNRDICRNSETSGINNTTEIWKSIW